MKAKKTYAAARDDFDLAKIDATFEGSFSDGVNACIECCDRHVGSGRAALNWIGSDGGSRPVSYDYLKEQSARFANMLKAHLPRRAKFCTDHKDVVAQLHQRARCLAAGG